MARVEALQAIESLFSAVDPIMFISVLEVVVRVGAVSSLVKACSRRAMQRVIHSFMVQR